MRAYDLAARVPWAITADALQGILDIARRENLSPEAVAAQLGRELENSHAVTIRDGVATIPVDGPIFRHANMFTRISGATSIETLAQDLRTALADPQVRAICLAIDSPGGEVNGVAEFADMVYAARNNGKRVVAYVSDMAASAAYWIASAADEVVVAATALVGSIGVVTTVRDPGSAKRGDGIVEFVSSQSPNKRPDVSTRKGAQQIQDTVDAIADVFVAAVARNRGVAPESVLEEFGQGGMFVGQAAVGAGLADRVGSYEQVHAELARRPASSPTRHTTQPAPAGTHAHAGGTMSAQDSIPVAQAAITPAEGGSKGLLLSVPEASASAAPAPQPAEVAALQAELAAAREATAAARAETARLRSERIASAAAHFADDQVRGLKATPAERELLVAAYVQAATDDSAGPAATLAQGQSRVSTLCGLLDARSAHQLTAELLPLGTLAPGTLHGVAGETVTHTGPKTYSREELMAKTPVGKRTRAARKAAGE